MERNLNSSEIQGSLAWHRRRLGHITGSCVAKIIPTGRGKDDIFSQTGYSYLNKLIGERLLDKSVIGDDEQFAQYLQMTNPVTNAMRWGTINEEEARGIYGIISGNDVTPCGSIRHPKCSALYVSPDGFVANETPGVIEIKCPGVDNYVKYATTITDCESFKKVNPDYYWQVVSEMSVTQTTWCDFILYHPYLVNPMHITRINLDKDDEALLIERVEQAENYINIHFNELCKNE